MIADDTADRPRDLIARQFTAVRPNQLRVADFTYASASSGLVFIAFVIDVFARRIVAWRVSRFMTTGLVLDTLEQALWARQVTKSPIHHRDRGGQYLSIRYSDRLAEVDAQAWVGSTGGSYDNTFAQTVIGLFKTEVMRSRGRWRNIDVVDVCHARVGGSDPSQPAIALDRRRSAGGAGNGVSSPASRVGHRGVIQTKWSPETPGLFISKTLLALEAIFHIRIDRARAIPDYWNKSKIL
jgi:transposase InsO family protein